MLYRAQVIHKHRSGQPRDNVVNVWWFLGPPGDESLADAEAVAERVRDFYVLPAAPGGNAPMTFFGPSVALTGHEIKVTPIDVLTGIDARGLGFPPYYVETFDHIGRVLPSAGLPAEVSVCVSFRATTPASVPPARRRGRIYFGPLASGFTEVEASTGRVNLTDTILNSLYDRANVFKDEVHPNTWVVYSRPYEGRGVIEREGKPPLPAIPARTGAAHDVDQVFMDDAFDTVRRRGERPVTRYVSAVS